MWGHNRGRANLAPDVYHKYKFSLIHGYKLNLKWLSTKSYTDNVFEK